MPTDILTLSEHLHRVGYQTAEFTANANAGRMNNLDRGDDVFREASWEEAEKVIVDQIVGTVKKFGGNSVGLYGSGQLPVEGQ